MSGEAKEYEEEKEEVGVSIKCHPRSLMMISTKSSRKDEKKKTNSPRSLYSWLARWSWSLRLVGSWPPQTSKTQNDSGK
jgi:hypothetical protein